MRRLICSFLVRILHKQAFSWRGSYGTVICQDDPVGYASIDDTFSTVLHCTTYCYLPGWSSGIHLDWWYIFHSITLQLTVICQDDPVGYTSIDDTFSTVLHCTTYCYLPGWSSGIHLDWWCVFYSITVYNLLLFARMIQWDTPRLMIHFLQYYTVQLTVICQDDPMGYTSIDDTFSTVLHCTTYCYLPGWSSGIHLDWQCIFYSITLYNFLFARMIQWDTPLLMMHFLQYYTVQLTVICQDDPVGYTSIDNAFSTVLQCTTYCYLPGWSSGIHLDWRCIFYSITLYNFLLFARMIQWDTPRLTMHFLQYYSLCHKLLVSARSVKFWKRAWQSQQNGLCILWRHRSI